MRAPRILDKGVAYRVNRRLLALCSARIEAAAVIEEFAARATVVSSLVKHEPKAEPLLVCKPDRKPPLVVISLDHFEELLRAADRMA